MKKSFGFGLVLSAISCSPVPTNRLQGAKAPLPPVMPVQYETLGFKFSPGRNCQTPWIDPSFCAATEPKMWQEQEFLAIEPWLAALPTAFLDRVKQNHFETFYRYGHGFRKLPDGGYLRDEPVAWVWGVDKSINISDFVFFADAPRDPLSGYDIERKTLVHELSHAFDAGSLGDGFIDLMGWSEVDGQWVLSGIDMNEVRSTYNEVKRLGWEGVAQNDPEKIIAALTLNREYGIAHGFPTTYAMTNPSECFAEIAAHIFIDPLAATYLRSEVRLWFDKIGIAPLKP